MVLGVGAKPKIAPSVVEMIAVDVVDLLVRIGQHNESVHECGAPTSAAFHIPHGVATEIVVPVPGRQHRIVPLVYPCDPAARHRDTPVDIHEIGPELFRLNATFAGDISSPPNLSTRS